MPKTRKAREICHVNVARYFFRVYISHGSLNNHKFSTLYRRVYNNESHVVDSAIRDIRNAPTLAAFEHIEYIVHIDGFDRQSIEDIAE